MFIRLRPATNLGLVQPRRTTGRNTDFTAAVSIAPVFFLSDAPCIGPNLVSRSTYSVLALSSSWGYPNSMDCVAVLYSGSPSLAVKVTMLYFSTEPSADLLRVRDGDVNSSSLIGFLSGTYNNLYVVTSALWAPRGSGA
jgi:hypothetical protein